MSKDRLKLKHIEIKGFKSIPPEGQMVDFNDITILLGANGSGKSNLVSFFKLLNCLSNQGLQVFIGKQGGADALLHYGSSNTDKINFSLYLVTESKETCAKTSYNAELIHGMPDRLFFTSEKITCTRAGSAKPHEYFLDSGNGESAISTDNRQITHVVHDTLSSIRAYQFHDTSDTAKIKSNIYIEDSKYLRNNAGNLAAFLYALSQNNKKYYDRITRHISKVMPQFKFFDLAPAAKNNKTVMLNWYDTRGETLFGPHQISDGSLRFMALAALLLQPPSIIPGIIILDEPELGLHPAAISELAGMIKTASKNSQIIVATQSTRLVDEFDIQNIIVVERDEKKHSSVFKQLDEKNLAKWLERYSVSELWEKNVFGGQP
jgi:predicted ATPase